MKSKKNLTSTLVYAIFCATFLIFPMFWMTSYLGFLFVTLAFFSALISISHMGVEAPKNGWLSSLVGIGIVGLFLWHAIVIIAMLKGSPLETPSQYYNEPLITMSKNHNFHKEIMYWGIYTMIIFFVGLISSIKQGMSKPRECKNFS